MCLTQSLDVEEGRFTPMKSRSRKRTPNKLAEQRSDDQGFRERVDEADCGGLRGGCRFAGKSLHRRRVHTGGDRGSKRIDRALALHRLQSSYRKMRSMDRPLATLAKNDRRHGRRCAPFELFPAYERT